jgi:RecJ-like exonuclease
MKARGFRAEGDFLVRALVDLISQCRAQIDRLECEFTELKKLSGERDVPRDILQAVHRTARQGREIGLSESDLRERLRRHRPGDRDSEFRFSSRRMSAAKVGELL